MAKENISILASFHLRFKKVDHLCCPIYVALHLTLKVNGEYKLPLYLVTMKLFFGKRQ